MGTHAQPIERWSDISKSQWLVLLTTFLAWGLDGFDGNIYSLVIKGAMGDLLKNTGITVNPSHIALFGGLAMTIYLVGWSLGALCFGLLADYFGRVRVLMFSILLYAVFTFTCAFVNNWYELAIFRFLTGLGSGVEWPIGAALIAETWNNKFRAKAGGLMMSGFAVGFFVSAVVYNFAAPISHFFGFSQSWRGLFLLGILPALIVVFTRGKIHEPEAMEEVKARRKALKNMKVDEVSEENLRYKRFALVQLFKKPYTRDSVVSVGMSIGGLFAFWAITGFTPSTVQQLMESQGIKGAAVVPYVTHSSWMLYLGGMIGYAAWGFIADKVGRKPAMAISFVFTLLAVFYPFIHSYNTFFWFLPFVGFGVFSFFSASAIYFAELFGTEVRATAISMANNVGRFITSPGPFIIGILVSIFGSYAAATAVVSATIIASIIILFWAKETQPRKRSIGITKEVGIE